MPVIKPGIDSGEESPCRQCLYGNQRKTARDSKVMKQMCEFCKARLAYAEQFGGAYGFTGPAHTADSPTRSNYEYTTSIPYSAGPVK